MSEQNLVDEFIQQDRVLISAELHLANGTFFQPTGFPDIGACIYTDGKGKRCCLVESEQSMANRLEAVCMKAPGVWREPLAGLLPVIRVKDKANRLLATNLTEPHRISSSYVLEGAIKSNDSAGQTSENTLEKRFEKHFGIDGKTWPLDGREKVTQAVFALDPGAILHGFQFMQWEAVGLRASRLLHARLEATLSEEGEEVHYGLVKIDGIESESSSGKKNNKGQSLSIKVRYVPESIQATFEIDVLALRERSLVADSSGVCTNQESQRFLLAFALWKIHRFLTNGPAFDARTGDTAGSLRLRSDCSLALGEISWSWSREGTAFSKPEPLAPEMLVKPGEGGGHPDLLVPPPSFEGLLQKDLLKDCGSLLEMTVIYER